MGIVGTNGIEDPDFFVEGLTGRSVRTSFRECMKVSKKWAYFDHAAVGPLPDETAQVIQNWCHQASVDGDVPWLEWSAAAQRTRTLGAQLMHCQAEEIALIPNTTFGINVIAHGYRWEDNRKPASVVVLENEFPSNFLPWVALRRRGVEVRKVPVAADGVVDLDAIAQAIDATTRLVTASWVGYASGYRLDVAKLCELVHERGAQLFLDAIQGLGVFTLDLNQIPVDYVAADGHKWLLGPEGAGYLMIRNKNLEFLEPMMMGWGSVTSASQFQSSNTTLKPNASRYEGGSANHAGLIGLAQSVRLLTRLGCNQAQNPVAETVLENAAHVEQELLRVGARVFRARSKPNSLACLSGIVSFEIPETDPMDVRKHLIQSGVVLSVRHHRLRIATHAYNNMDDIDRLCRSIQAYKKPV